MIYNIYIYICVCVYIILIINQIYKRIWVAPHQSLASERRTKPE